MGIYDFPVTEAVRICPALFWEECLDSQGYVSAVKSLCKIIRVGIRVGTKYYN